MSINKKDGAFSRKFTVLVLSLVGICSVFVVLNMLQPPRLRYVEVDRAAVTQESNQRIVLYTNQPLARITPEQVTIQPKAKFSASVTGEAIVVQLNERLMYDTTYLITVRGAEGADHRHKNLTLSYSFKTEDAVIYYRTEKDTDTELNSLNGPEVSKRPGQIVRTTLHGKEKRVIFAESDIQEFAVSGDTMLVATHADTQSSNLYMVDIPSGRSTRLSLPGKGTVEHLKASPNQRLLGFIFSSPYDDKNQKYNSDLFNIDLAAKNLMYQVRGFKGKTLQVQDWDFAPDGTTIVANTYEGALLLVDTNGKHEPVSLGNYEAFTNFSSDGSKLMATDKMNDVIIDLIKHTVTPIEDYKVGETTLFGFGTQLLANQDGYIQKLEKYVSKGDDEGEDEDEAEADSSTTYYLLIRKPSGDTIVYTVDGKIVSIEYQRSSPNDQYIGMVMSPAYNPDNTKASTEQYITILDTATKKIIKKISGVDITWE